MLIDRVEEYKEGEHLIAIKNITANEWCFGDSQNIPSPARDGLIFPEVLLIEAAAQAVLVLYHVSKIKSGQKPKYVLGAVKAKFINQIFVGSELSIEVLASKMLDKFGYMDVNIGSNTDEIAKIKIVYSVRFYETPS